MKPSNKELLARYGRIMLPSTVNPDFPPLVGSHGIHVWDMDGKQYVDMNSIYIAHTPFALARRYHAVIGGNMQEIFIYILHRPPFLSLGKAIVAGGHRVPLIIRGNAQD